MTREQKLSIVKKTGIVFAVLVVLAIIIGIVFLIVIMRDFKCSQLGYYLEGMSKEEVKLVFGEDVFMLDEEPLFDIGLDPYYCTVHFSRCNDTLRNEKITGYEESADSYNIVYQGQHQASDDVFLTSVDIYYQKDMVSSMSSPPTKPYGDIEYRIETKRFESGLSVTMAKDNDILSVDMKFVDSQGNSVVLGDDLFATYLQMMLDMAI